MALRVLLADESSTIKKVMQLALQDFGVEVKSVANGIDVLPVAEAFQPQIVFADVLLAKKSGYDVCGEIKNDPKLGSTPVVLMWSSFMEIDAAKADASKANHRLEKPFDAETLRKIVKDLVPSLKDNVISDYLSFPEMPEFVEGKKPPEEAIEIAADLEEPDEFQQVPLPKAQRKEIRDSNDENWSHKDLSRFKIKVPQEASLSEEYHQLEDLEDAQVAVSSVEAGPIEVSLKEPDSIRAPKIERVAKSTTFSRPASAAPEIAAISPDLVEQILREKAEEMVQELAWKILPDIVERVVREEMQKLLNESEKLP